LVGIGYENSAAVDLLRWRDFATREMREPRRERLTEMAASPLVNRPDLIPAALDTTDATQFLRFLTDELMPFVDSRYPTANENHYFGYSAGGLFGLYALFTRPNTFKSYILGSPGTAYLGRDFGIELAQEFFQSKQAANAKIFLSVGELEEFRPGHEPFEFVTSYYRLRKFLQNSVISGLEVTGRVFPGETHATAWTLAFIHGLKTVLGPANSVLFG
jgi:predicted alpha/beta superfamily hydrolase